MRGSNEDWLFPGEAGGHKGLTTLSDQISDRIMDGTGIDMTSHMFRHAAGAIVLQRFPGNYELVRRLLGHKNIKTTTDFYIGLESTQASEIYGNLIIDHVRDHGGEAHG